MPRDSSLTILAGVPRSLYLYRGCARLRAGRWKRLAKKEFHPTIVGQTDLDKSVVLDDSDNGAGCAAALREVRMAGHPLSL
jgi:hypothetical protein